MKYIKLFDNETGYEEFVNSNNYVTPNICAVKDGQGGVKKDFVFFNPEEEVNINLISFYIDGTPFQCEEGMTWQDWVNSDYNTGEYKIIEYCLHLGTYIVVTNSSSYGEGYGVYNTDNVKDYELISEINYITKRYDYLGGGN